MGTSPPFVANRLLVFPLLRRHGNGLGFVVLRLINRRRFNWADGGVGGGLYYREPGFRDDDDDGMVSDS